MKHNVSLDRFKYFLNFIYLLRLVQAAMDVQEVEAYRARLWFQSAASPRRVSRAGSRPTAKASIQLRKKLCAQRNAFGFFGTKYGRISSLPPAVKVIA